MNVRLMIQKTKTDKSGSCPIYVEVSVNPKGGLKVTRRIPTGEKIPARYWSKKQEAMSSYAGYQDINSAILNKKLEVQQIIRNNPDASPDEIKLLTEKKPVIKIPSIIELYEEFIEFKKARLTPNGMKAIYALQNFLNAYHEAGHKLSLKQLDQDTFDSLYTFAIARYNHRNTALRRFETLTTFLNHLTDRNINNNLEYKKWKLPRLVPTKMTTLTNEELAQVVNLEITNKKLDRVRDLFVLLCSTGLRFGDGIKLRPHDVHDNFILVRADKTNEILSIPLNSYSKAILDKYESNLESLAISNQKFNVYIKDVCKAAGLKSIVSVDDKTKEKKTVQKEKWEVVSSHCGRRSFATLGLKSGIRQDVVMALTGHKDYRSFKKYIDHTSELKSEEMLKLDKMFTNGKV